MKQSKKSTLQIIHEYSSEITKYYLVAMLILVPLYKQDGYANIADAKYTMYKFLTLSFLILCGCIFFSIETIIQRGKNISRKQSLPMIFLLSHLLLHVLTFIFSTDHETSFVGNGSWHMGFFTQLMILISALLVCYYYKDEKIIWIAALAGTGVTSLLTILNRFDIYPIDMGNKYPGFISTLGQTNWATMYIACVMGACLGLYIYEKNNIVRIVLLIIDGIMLTGLWMIGSDTAFPVMIAEFFILFGICLKKRELLTRFAELLGLWGITAEITYILVFVMFHENFVFVDENDAVNSLLRSQIGLALIAISVIMYFVIRATGKRIWNKEILSNLFKVLSIFMVVSLLIVIVLMVIVTLHPENAGALSNVRMLRFDDDWGTHRGLNWKCSVAGFIRMNPLRKIIGMGQGNFEAYIYSFGDLADRLVLMYGEFRLRVAHNEYLNMLIENGILGLVSYAGFIVSSFTFLWKRADENRLSLIALLSLAGYFACSVFFFQQFYATPYMYLFIAMAISGIREEK